MYQSVIRDPGGDRLVRIVPDFVCVDGSVLIVPADTVAFFICNGIVSEPYGPGRYTLNTGISPFFVRLRNIMTNGDPAVSVSVFFVATSRETCMPLGTGEIVFNERRFQLSMKAKASVSVRYRISDPSMFLKRLVGRYSSQFHEEDLEPALQSMTAAPVREQLGRYLAQISIAEMNNNLTRIGNNMAASLAPIFTEYGMQLREISIVGVNIPDGEMARLQELEREHAQGRVQTDVEKYNLEQVYGTIDRRTMVEALTGVPRGQARGGQPAPPPQGGMGGMAGMMAALPVQMALATQMAAAMRPPVEEMTRQSSLFGPREPDAQEGGRQDPAPAGVPGAAARRVMKVPPPLPGRTSVCAQCGVRVSGRPANCPVCGSRMQK
ncbi:MAG: SPFH domain-containing protein [Clostridiaceae bacterium]